MRIANITAGVAVATWFALALLGRDVVNGVIAQRAPGYPNMGQINLYMVWPLLVVAALLVCAWICNAFHRWPWLLGLVSGAALVALLPFVAVWGGGV